MTSFVKKLSALLGRRKSVQSPPQDSALKAGQGFLVFEQTGEVIAAERLLKEQGFSVCIKGPPPWLRTGCDMVLVFDLMRTTRIHQLLETAHLVPLKTVPVHDPLLEPVSLSKVTDFGDWFMVSVANMKITIAKKDGVIVNVSGGGCPDVPYLAGLLTGQSIASAQEPKLEGRTLCSYALQKAFEEARRLWRG